MKKLVLLILSLLIIQISAISQPCLPEGIIFTTQSQIDSFQINYPNCTDIEGYIEISGDGITNLDGLLGITEINGNLAILDNDVLNSLFGLSYLNHVGGHLYIGVNSETGNPSLSGLTGLNNLSTIGGNLKIVANHQLLNLHGFNGLISIGGDLAIGGGSVIWGYIGNNLLANLDGLENLEYIGNDLLVYANPSLNNLEALNGLNYIPGRLFIMKNNSLVNLSGLDGITSIGEGLYIYDNQSLNSLIGLEGISTLNAGIIIKENDSLSSLLGLNNLNFVDGEIRIAYNPLLTNLSGLNNVNHISGGLMIYGNNSIIDLTALSNLTSIGLTTIPTNYGIIITANPLLHSLSGIENIEASTIEVLEIISNSTLSSCEVRSICDYLASPNTEVSIYNNAPGCNSIEEVEDACDTLSIHENNFEDSFIVSPNPCSNHLNLNFTIFNEEYVVAELFEISGNKVKDLLNETKMPGIYNMELDISNLPTGVYLIRFQTNNDINMKKLVKR